MPYNEDGRALRARWFPTHRLTFGFRVSSCFFHSPFSNTVFWQPRLVQIYRFQMEVRLPAKWCDFQWHKRWEVTDVKQKKYTFVYFSLDRYCTCVNNLAHCFEHCRRKQEVHVRRSPAWRGVIYKPGTRLRTSTSCVHPCSWGFLSEFRPLFPCLWCTYRLELSVAVMGQSYTDCSRYLTQVRGFTNQA